MRDRDPSPLELAILGVFFDRYGSDGFPAVEAIEIVSRRNTGAGRFVGLSRAGKLTCADGYLDMGGRHIEMEDVPNGLMAVVSVANSSIEELEIVVYGNGSWDGAERIWKII